MNTRPFFLLFVGLWACAAQNTGSKPAPDSTKLGDYLVEPERPSETCGVDKHGSFGQLTKRIFHQDRLVTSSSFFSFVSPWNPSRLLYSVAPTCAGDEEHTGTFYFDGRRDAPVHVAVSGTVDSPEMLPHLWSADDRFVALPANGMEFTLLNLQTTQTTNLSKLFYNQESLISSVKFCEWSPDGKKLAISVSSMFSQKSGRMWNESDLLSVDPASLQPTYVATMRREDGWGNGQFVWISKAGGFELSVDPGLRNSATIFLKPQPSSATSKTLR